MSEKIVKLLESGESEVIVKKSRFIGITYPVNTPEEAADFVNSIKKKYYDARHNCYAYVIGDKREQIKFSDDGEPGGTAGKPMLDVLLGSGITNIVVVVTRYFGGTLLGTGGLVRAYSTSAIEAINNAGLKEINLKNLYLLQIEYNQFSQINHIFSELKIITKSINYNEKIDIEFYADESEINKLEEKQIVNFQLVKHNCWV